MDWPGRGVWSAVVLTLGAAACHSYVPVERPSAGTTVRAAVPVASVTANPNRPPAVLSVEGTVLATPADSVIMAIRNRREVGQFRVVVEVDTVRLARDGLLALEEQVLSVPKTVAFTAALSAGAVGVALAAYRAGSGQRGDGGPGNGQIPASMRIPPGALRAALAFLTGR